MPDIAARRARRTRALAEPLIMAGRCLRMSRRQVDALLTSVLLPVMLMLVFVYLFGGAIATGTKYVTYVVPGVLLLCAAVGSAGTAVAVSQDMTRGIIDRFRSMDIGGGAVLSGHVAAGAVRNAVSTVLVFGVAFAIGFRPHAGPAAWLAVAGILLLFVLAICWLCAAIGLLASSPEAANGAMFLLMFVTYASSAFVPVRTMPSWMRGFAASQPATPVIETLRGLLLHTPAGTSPWRALAWCGGILVVSAAAAAALFRRRTARP
jgi:ABC-2 type transport system permease protein